MLPSTFGSLLLLSLVSAASASGTGRSLLQSASPPNADFGGPQVQLTSVQAPAGNTVKINWHAVGTQNYTSSSTSAYVTAGAVADFYLQNGTTVVGQHFFISNGNGGISPVFTKTDAQGNVQGMVVGAAMANQTAQAANDDGGYGSVPYLLLKAVTATGFFQGVTFVQRINTLGGVVPGNPALFTLPSSPTGIANKLLTVPYQADYLFLTDGSTASTPPASSTTATTATPPSPPVPSTTATPPIPTSGVNVPVTALAGTGKKL